MSGVLGNARVLALEELIAHHYLLLLEEPQLASQAYPGQFLHLRVRDSLAPFLRRPFSIAGVSPDKGTLQIVFRVVGEGTAVLSRVKKGSLLACLGPLGKGFKLSPHFSQAILLAGGMGIAPLLFLAQALAKEQRKAALFYGTASAAELLPLSRFLPRATEVYLATEDGGRGYHGRVTELLAETLQGGSLKPAALFACGPRLMLRALVAQNRDWEFPLQLSLEENMACGLGACQGCAVKIRQGDRTSYRMVCSDGPVFEGQEVEWQEWLS